jgi:F-type H+-transporting ATPase subunit epsilon
MTGLKFDICSAERMVYSDEVDMIIAPGISGQLGILPHHAPLMTTLRVGELRVKKGEEEISLAISGGFLEVRPDRVIVLADSAERADEIDVARAEKAKRQAESRLAGKHVAGADEAQVHVALERALARLAVVDKVTKRKKKG